MPGTSGVLSPFGKIEGLYFNDSNEPDSFAFEFKKDISRIMKEDNVDYLEFKVENKEDYYKLLNELSDFTKNSIKISGTSRNEMAVIVERDDQENTEAETTAK